MTGQHRLTDYIAVFDPGADTIGQAEFVARLAALLDAAPETLDDAIRALPAARLVRLLHENRDDARRLRERLRLVARADTAKAVSAALARVEVEGRQPVGALREALLAVACREPITPEERLVVEIREAREEVLALWPEAFDAVARWGAIDQRAAWSIGIGSMVYGMICEALGRTAEERITREEFVRICPRLVEFWPLTPASHESMHALLAIVRAAAAGRLAASAGRLEAVN
jgi:hypothetical protein